MTSGSNNVLASRGMAVRHIPQRTCIGCRQSSAKRRLVRVVRLPSGSVQMDPTGKKSGRGAYLCWDRRCWEAALKRKSLEHALKTTITPVDRAALESYAQQIPGGQTEEGHLPSRGGS